MLAALTLGALLLGAAVLSWGEVRGSLRLASAARQLATDLGQARLRAITGARDVRVVAAGGTADYRLEAATAAGWETIRSAALPATTRVLASSAPGGTIRFTPRGNAAAFGTITLEGDGGATRRVIVNIAGRVRVSG